MLVCKDGERQGTTQAYREPGAPAGDLLQASRRASEESSGDISAVRCRRRHHRLLRPWQAL